VRHRGDFAKQYSYSLDKIKRMLATRKADFSDVTTIRAYLTDGRHTGALYKCLDEVYGSSKSKPAVTVANISQLAHSGMMVEMEITAALPGSENDKTFSIYKNSKTRGTWNPGANEVLEASGPDRTFYLSGAQAMKYEPGKPMVAMHPGDFAKQCDFLYKQLDSVLKAEGAASTDVVRSTSLMTGDATLGELFGCRKNLPKGVVFSNPGTLATISQLSSLGEVFTYDAIGMAAPSKDQDPNKFAKKVVPSELNPDVPSAVIVSGPRRTLNIAGQGAQDKSGTVQFKGDFKAQCKAALQIIDNLLRQRKASLDDVVKMLVFVTDSRYAPEFRVCMADAFKGKTQPAQTFVNVARNSAPGMLIQIDATAVAAP